MKKIYFKIEEIPAVLYGEESNKVFLTIHGAKSNKEDTVVLMAAEEITKRGYQVLAIDMPASGERQIEDEVWNLDTGTKSVRKAYDYCLKHYNVISLWANSLGAYMSLVELQEDNLSCALFLSPILSLRWLTEQMMVWSNVTLQELKEKVIIPTTFGEDLNYPYYLSICQRPIEKWYPKTKILRGENDYMQSIELTKEFCNQFGASLKVCLGGNHYFHEELELIEYKKWLTEALDELLK